MKQARYKEPLPLAVIEAARAGDAGAVEQVLQYYNGYINKLCTRTLYDDCGQLHVCVDEYMKHRLENKLIYSVLADTKSDIIFRNLSFPLVLGLLTASHPFGAGRAVFGPVRLRLERGPTLAAAFHFIPVFDDFGVQSSVQWEDGCLKPPAQQRIGNALYANTFLAIVQ